MSDAEREPSQADEAGPAEQPAPQAEPYVCEVARKMAQIEAVRRDASRCPNCGAEDYCRARQSRSEADLMVAARQCKRCGCVWRRAWSKREALVAIVLGCFLLVFGAVMLPAVASHAAAAEISALWLALIFLFAVWNGWFRLIREGWRTLHGRGEPAEVFEPGRPVGRHGAETE